MTTKHFKNRTPKSENSMAQDLCAFSSVVFVIIALVGYLPEIAKAVH